MKDTECLDCFSSSPCWLSCHIIVSLQYRTYWRPYYRLPALWSGSVVIRKATSSIRGWRFITHNEVQDLTGVTYSAANQLVSKMEEQGILREFTGQSRNRRFRYEDYIALFADPAP